jgi:hypothetical protein
VTAIALEATNDWGSSRIHSGSSRVLLNPVGSADELSLLMPAGATGGAVAKPNR